MNAPGVDLTKVKFTPMALVWLFLAFTAALLLFGAAQYAVGKLQSRVPAVGRITGGAGAPSEENPAFVGI